MKYVCVFVCYIEDGIYYMSYTLQFNYICDLKSKYYIFLFREDINYMYTCMRIEYISVK